VVNSLLSSDIQDCVQYVRGVQDGGGGGGGRQWEGAVQGDLSLSA